MRYIKSALILITCMAVLFSQSTMAGEPDQTQQLIEQIVVSYAALGEKNEQQLSDLAALDPALGDKWNQIDDGYANLRYFYAQIMKRKAAGTLAGNTAARINLKHFSVVNDFDKPMPAAAFEKKLAEGRYS